MVPKVHLIKPGSILRDDDGAIIDARSSVTLISAGEQRIVVDTGLQGEEAIILDSLSKIGLEPNDIDIIINTHDHPDHTGNNHLFSKAKPCAAKEGDWIEEGVRIIKTPGHSEDSISVVVESNVVIVLAGDALPTFSNYLQNLPPALNIDRNQACKSMSRILKIADIIVPGHDRPFSVCNRAYVTL